MLVFRLPRVAMGNDGVILPWVADDRSGQRWAMEHPAFAQAEVLYAAPAVTAKPASRTCRNQNSRRQASTTAASVGTG
ncbi:MULTISPECIES: hypothetical protein [Methylococcus]|uniref:Uncharacterized protein n=1 Tax=Methylococcus capsulatus TaxID=414 RepID=A0ABZ2F8W6_METCP|nr:MULTISPECIES: hypothetical protein [Methylococcus]MDF9392995.1 hypothetical protein [Methylococcus capsulatus]